jgi:hypothetical protein
MAEPQDEKQRIILELSRTRAQLSEQSALVQRNLDINQHLTNSIREHSWAWISVAAIFGWLLSRLPARKKKVYIESANSQKRKARAGGLLRLAWNGAWSIAKPLLTAYLTKKIAEKARIPGTKWL